MNKSGEISLKLSRKTARKTQALMKIMSRPAFKFLFSNGVTHPPDSDASVTLFQNFEPPTPPKRHVIYVSSLRKDVFLKGFHLKVGSISPCFLKGFHLKNQIVWKYM